jgi:hypothetical protein
MENLIREFCLPNGLTFACFNQSRRYFGDYFRVMLEVICKVPVRADYFKEASAYAEARALLGEEIVYRRHMGQMGVASGEIDRVLTRLMAEFEKHAMPYIAASEFPRKFVSGELQKIKRKKSPIPPQFHP